MKSKEISLCVGGIADADGAAVRRLPIAAGLAELGAGRRVLAVHRPGAGADSPELWIIADGPETEACALYWCEAPAHGPVTPGQKLICELAAPAVSAAAIGALVAVATEGGLHYIRWTGTGYTSLGTTLPQFAVEFRLVRESLPIASRRLTIDLGDALTAAAVSRAITSGGASPSFRLSASERHAVVRGSMTDAVMGALREVANTYIISRGRFWQPFLVRCALRLYDGSAVGLTPPVALWPMATAPLLPVSELAVDADALTLSATTSFEFISRCRLEMRVLQADPAALELWRSLVTSVDVAVTEPVTTFVQSDPVAGVGALAGLVSMAEGQRPGSESSEHSEPTELSPFLGHWAFPGRECMEQHASAGSLDRPGWLIAPRSEADFDADFCGRSVFRLFERVDFDRLLRLATTREWSALTGRWAEGSSEAGASSALSAQPILPDSLNGADRWDAEAMTVYNSRLILAPRRRLLPAPPPLRAMTCHSGATSSSDRRLVSVAVHRTIAGSAYTTVRSSRAPGVNSPSASDLSPDSVASLLSRFPRWLYVDAPDATELVLVSGEWGDDASDPVTIRLPLRRHPTMNGTYWYGGRGPAIDLTPFITSDATGLAAAGPAVVACGAMLLTSEPQCPMAFGVGSAVELPGRRVMAVRAALRPMSAGQFGSYPLYAFTDCGVSALQPADAEGVTGATWLSQRLVTPCGLAAPDALTAVDSGVAYVSSGGVMLLTGSELRRLDGPLSGRALSQPPLSSLPHFEVIAAMAGCSDAVAEDAIDPISQASLCGPAYDPRHSLLLLYRRSIAMALRVYSPVSGTWALLRLDAPVMRTLTAAEGSTQPLLSCTDGRVCRLEEAPQSAPVLAVTAVTTVDRPRRHGRIELAGLSAAGPESITLYGSNDLVNFQPVASVRGNKMPLCVAGTPRRHFVIAAVASKPAFMLSSI